MKVLSLCNGMGCAEIALIEAGIEYDELHYSEVDKFANQQQSYNFPNSIPLGDIRTVEVKDHYDLVLAGTPCKNLSFAGLRDGLICASLNDYLKLRSKWLETGDESLYVHNGKFQESILFWEFVRILEDAKKINPQVNFLLENVRMLKPQQVIINRTLGLFPVALNSNLVSAQNRYRLYWSNIRVRKDGLFDDFQTDFPQPEDEGIILADIIDSDVDEKYYLKNIDLDVEKVAMDIMGKCRTVRAGGKSTLSKKHNHDIIKVPDKSYCIDANYSKGASSSDLNNNKCKRKVVCVAMRGRNPDNPSDRRAGIPLEQTIEPNTDSKSNCLTSISKDNLIVEVDKWVLRKLTPTECAKLQTVPDWYKWIVSESQQYKLLGNGWTIKVIVHMLKFLKKNV